MRDAPGPEVTLLRSWTIVVAVVGSLLVPFESIAAPILYGGVGRGSMANAGNLIIIDPTTGSGALVGSGTGLPGLNGLAYAPGNVLYGSTINNPVFGNEPPTSELVRLDPVTGTVIGSPLDITLNGGSIFVNDLALHPITGILYANMLDMAANEFLLLTLDPITGIATEIGGSGVLNASLAFGLDGTLYSTAATFDANGAFVAGQLHTINPTTGQVVTTVGSFGTHVGGLAVRPTDGVIFASGNQGGGIYTLSLSGEQQLIGFTNTGAPGDIAFAPIPEPASAGLVVVAAGMLAVLRLRSPKRRTGDQHPRR
jgi:hypothetical protein